MEDMKISVRRLVEFLLREGDIDNRHGTGSKEEAMQAGSRLHRKLQKRAGASYRAEVALSITIPDDGFVLTLEGRADGIIHDDSGVTVDEIKGMYQNVMRLTAPILVHEAQAKCYAYMYAAENGLDEITVRMTYANLETEQIKYFHETYSFAALKAWFDALIERYLVWARWEHQHRLQMRQSVKTLEFPYAYRKGQRDMAVAVYAAIHKKENLFVQAPTGIGKTMATIFPSVKAMGEGNGEKIFYLTAKTSLSEVAMQAFDILRGKGACFQTIAITAKEKICPMEQTECNPEVCPYARGHYDRINTAIFAIICQEERIDREVLMRYARMHQVCPFEYALDVSLFMDGIICDYNYVFDPRVNLKRYFAEGNQGDYLFLVDEAHNLTDRASAMFSAELYKEEILHVRHLLKEAVKLQTGKQERTEAEEEILKKQRKLIAALGTCNQELLAYRNQCESYRILEDIEPFALKLSVLESAYENYLESARQVPQQEEVLQLYFKLLHFNHMYQTLDDGTVIYCEALKNKSFFVKLYCINPAVHLRECLCRARSTIFFSATMLPIHYYKELLGNTGEDKAIYIASPFAGENRKILIGTDVSSRYRRRGRNEYLKYCAYIRDAYRMKPGNYMVFFPSYQMLADVFAIATELGLHFEMELVCQEANMSEEKREQFLNRFVTETGLVAFCILGGIFSEGIDLVREHLIGAFVIGTGLPMVCNEREIMVKYFSSRGKNGFDYAYRYPGMNKVEQAAGRVIRTEDDRGVILLLDDRFYTKETIQLFPVEWSDYEVVVREDVPGLLEQFWSETRSETSMDNQ